MPNELVIKQGDLARQLCFAIKGTLAVRDGKGHLVEFLTGEGTGPCVAGAISFLLGEQATSPWLFAAVALSSHVPCGMLWFDQSPDSLCLWLGGIAGADRSNKFC